MKSATYQLLQTRFLNFKLDACLMETLPPAPSTSLSFSCVQTVHACAALSMRMTTSSQGRRGYQHARSAERLISSGTE